MFYIILQGQNVEVIESKERPNLAVKRGENRKKILGKSADRASLEARAKAYCERAVGATWKGGK